LEPTLIDDRVLEAIEAISHLALLHNHPSIESIRAASGIALLSTVRFSALIE
jgi:acetate kinase